MSSTITLETLSDLQKIAISMIITTAMRAYEKNNNNNDR
jgi:hypothetical protein